MGQVCAWPWASWMRLMWLWSAEYTRVYSFVRSSPLNSNNNKPIRLNQDSQTVNE